MITKVPGVYLEERKNSSKADPSTVSAIPIFMGYTEFAKDNTGNSLKGQPILVHSFSNFQFYFGQDFVPQKIQIELERDSGALIAVKPYQNDFGVSSYYLWKSVRAFFDNGGSFCYILSVGYYDTEFSGNDFLKKIDNLRKLESPLLIVTPDVVILEDLDIFQVQKAILNYCADNKKDFYIADIPNGNQVFSDVPKKQNPISNFRTSMGVDALNFGASYYPWVFYDYPVHTNLQNWEIIDENGATLNISNYFSNTQADAVKALEKGASDLTFIFSKRTDEIVNEGNYRQLLQQFFVMKEKLDELGNDEWHNARIYFNHLLKYVVETVWQMQRLDNDRSLSSSLRNQIEFLKNNKELQKQIQKLIGFINKALREEFVLFSYQNFYLDFKNDLKQTVWVSGLKDLEQLYDDTVYTGTLVTERRKSAANSPLLFHSFSVISELFIAFIEKVENETQSSLSTWLNQEEIYQKIYDSIQMELNLYPPSGAIAGVYFSTDKTRGAWKSPAKVVLNNVTAISQKITDRELESLYVDVSGKSINGLRAYPGQGIMIWGARTLDGNSNEWRYINVRRYFSLVEESVKRMCRRFVFEANDASTWTSLKGLINSFLYNEWKGGAMAGNKPDDAYFIKIGLGLSMTQEDVLQGRMIVNIGLAVARPAEFIIIKITQNLQGN